MRKSLLAICALCMLLLASVAAFGQATASSALQGTVLDKTGAAVVGAEVTVSSPSTGFTRTVKTSSDGVYRVDPLQVGIYNIKVTMAGFGVGSAQKVETVVGSTQTQNFTLVAGSTSTTIEVTTQAPIIDQTKTDVSQSISPTEVQQLPLIGRDVADLAYLAPGVKAADSYDPTKNRYAILSVNGQGGRNVNVTVNGVDNKDNTVGGPVMQLPLEGVEEFTIATQRFNASNGRSEGAAINLITKSGTNSYHGSAFGQFREQAFNADQKLANPGGKPISINPPYSRQFFGGSIGGPIKKDKLFTFFAFERQREHTSIAENPLSLSELQLVTSLGAQPAAIIPTPFFENRYTGRADYRFTDRESAYFSVSEQANNSLNDQSGSSFDLSEGNFTVNHMQIANLTLNSALSNTLVNQATLGFQYWNNVIDSKGRTPLITFPNEQFGTNTNVPQQSFQRKYQFKDDITKIIGNHSFKAGADYIYNPTLGGYFGFNSTLEIDFADDPSCILGVGRNAGNPSCGPHGTPFAYTSGFSTPGAVQSMSFANGDPSTNVPGGTKQFGIYLQDDWKATRKLTLNLGIRWDKDFNMVGGAAVHNSRTYQQLRAIASISPLAQLFSAKQAQDDNKDFSPRIGFAYDLNGNGKNILRGGYGLYYGDIFQNIPIFMEQQHNPFIFQTVLALSGSDAVPGTGKTLPTYQFGVDPLPTLPPPSATLATGATGRIMDPNYRNPVTEEFNFGYSRELGSRAVAEVEYVHVLSLHENKTVNIDPRIPVDPNNITTLSRTGAPGGFFRPFDSAFAAASQPVLASVRDDQSVGRSRYDGLNFSYRQRLTHNFSLNANYTLSRAVSYDGGGGSFRNYPRDPQNLFSKYEFGPTFNDERHHVTISSIVNLPFGFEFAPIVQIGSARPFNVIAPYNELNLAGGSAAGALIVPNSDPTNYTAFSSISGATKLAAAQCYYSKNCHISQFDPLRGDPFYDVDARLAKNFKFGETRNLQLSFQAFNLLNHTNYGNNFDGTATRGSTSTFDNALGFINPTSATLPRAFVGEFGARFSF